MSDKADVSSVQTCWRVQLTLPHNPLPLTLCVCEGGDCLAAVIRAITRPGVTVSSPITLERQIEL